MGCGSSQPEQAPQPAPVVAVVPGSSYSYITHSQNQLDFNKDAFKSKANEYDFLFKILLIGNSGVGKSALIMRFADDIFHTSFASTIGVDFKLRTVEIDGQKIKLQIWDTAGQERFRTVTNAYFRGSHGIILVYDITKSSSFESLDAWIQELNKSAPVNSLRLIVGNKCDLEDQREVSREQAMEYSKKNGIHYMETSAKESTNVNDAFLYIAHEIKERIKSS